MTIEQKAKSYDEALKRAKTAIDIAADKDLVKGVATTIFPELRESEDERIRKALIDGVRQIRCKNDITQEQMIAYLEKQKEQKPAEQLGGTFTSYDMAKTFTEGQNYVIAHPKKFGLCKPAEWSEDTIRCGIREVGLTQHQIDWLKKNVCPQPKQEWSEENEKMLEIVIANYEYMFDKLRKGDDSDGIADHILIMDWLKSLRPQPHWKPSEEQMDALKDVAYGTYQNGDGPALRSLYEQLKKLI